MTAAKKKEGSKLNAVKSVGSTSADYADANADFSQLQEAEIQDILLANQHPQDMLLAHPQEILLNHPHGLQQQHVHHQMGGHPQEMMLQGHSQQQMNQQMVHQQQIAQQQQLVQQQLAQQQMVQQQQHMTQQQHQELLASNHQQHDTHQVREVPQNMSREDEQMMNRIANHMANDQHQLEMLHQQQLEQQQQQQLEQQHLEQLQQQQHMEQQHQQQHLEQQHQQHLEQQQLEQQQMQHQQQQVQQTDRADQLLPSAPTTNSGMVPSMSGMHLLIPTAATATPDGQGQYMFPTTAQSVPAVSAAATTASAATTPSSSTSKKDPTKRSRVNVRITPVQDQLIIEAFAMYGTCGQSGRPHWSKIAEHANVKYGQAQKRWKKYLDPMLVSRKMTPWTEEEKTQLIALAEANKNLNTNRINWRKVSDTLERREVDCTSCYAHWMRAEEAAVLKKGPFGAEEDEVILHMIRVEGKSFAEVSRKLGRPLSTVRRRYIEPLSKR